MGVSRTIPSSLAFPWEQALAANSTDSNFTDPSASIVAKLPSDVFAVADGTTASQGVDVGFIGVGSDGQTYTARLIGYSTVKGGYLFREIYRTVATFGTFSYDGVSVHAKALAAPTPTGTEGVDCVTSGGNPAYVFVDTKGSEFVKPEFKMGNMTNGNALFRRV